MRKLTAEDGEDVHGRALSVNPALSKNWVALGKVGPVKNQGSCGSCWAFSALSTQESIEMIAWNAPYTRLSEQQALECTIGSCGGGWMRYSWNDSIANGNARNADYPYTATSSSPCAAAGLQRYSRVSQW